MSLEHKDKITRMAEELSKLLCLEDEFPCTLKIKHESSCMVRAQNAVTSSGAPVPFDQAEVYVDMCASCLAYWLSLRLSAVITRLK